MDAVVAIILAVSCNNFSVVATILAQFLSVVAIILA
jgi:hypothetical protein